MKPLTAIVAEDDYLVSLEVVRAAQGAGLTVLAVATDGEQALALVRQHAPAVVLLDIQMPVMTGLEAARRIRDECPTPVVILTAYESTELLLEARDAGVGAYVTKPPDAASLRRAVEIAVGRHSDLMEVRQLNMQLRQALDQIQTLQSFLPLCMYCKKIRDEDGTWHRLEDYIYQRTRTEFSHGMCEACYDAEVGNIMGTSEAP